MDAKKLSILIPTLESRQPFFDKLMCNLASELHYDSVEILVNKDEKQKSIGAKRNELVQEAKGEYIAFIDDDDLVAPNYQSLVLKAIASNPDVVGINLIMTTDEEKAEQSFHSINYRTWFEIKNPLDPNKKVYFRNPNHLNPVKRSIALQVPFPEISMGEDKVYSDKLLPLLKTEVQIDQPIYFYLFRTKK